MFQLFLSSFYCFFADQAKKRLKLTVFSCLEHKDQHNFRRLFHFHLLQSFCNFDTNRSGGLRPLTAARGMEKGRNNR